MGEHAIENSAASLQEHLESCLASIFSDVFALTQGMHEEIGGYVTKPNRYSSSCCDFLQRPITPKSIIRASIRMHRPMFTCGPTAMLLVYLIAS